MNQKLINVVIKQLGCRNQYSEKCLSVLKDVADHGADSGFHGFIYHYETCKFYFDNRPLIIELAKEYAQDFGTGLMEMIAGFNCLKGTDLTDEIGQALYASKNDNRDNFTVPNALAWFALEEVARYITDKEDQETEEITQ